MPTKKAEYFYKEMKSLTAKIGRTSLVKELIELAKQCEKLEMSKVTKQFKVDNPKLWDRISKFYTDYYYENSPAIFSDEISQREKYGLYQYKASEINPLNLIVFFALSDGKIYSDMVWKSDTKRLQDALKRRGYPQIAQYIKVSDIWRAWDLAYAFQ